MDTETRLVAIDSEANGLCLSCTRLEAGSAKYQDLLDRLSSALRLCKFALAACFFFCILLVLMFSCSVYLFMEIQTVHQELSRLRTSQTIADDNSSSTSDVLYLLADDGLDIQENEIINQRGFRSSDPKKKNENDRKLNTGSKRKKNRCCKCCKKVRKLERSFRSLEQSAKQQTTQQPLTTFNPGSKDKSRISYVAAAHYSTYMTEEFINQLFGTLDPGNLDKAVTCREIEEWHGEACRNRTFTPHGSAVTLNVFKEADWMKNVSQEDLFDKRADGTFVARHTGIYLLYTHVLFYDVKTKQSVAIIHESGGISKNVLRCMESVDYVDPNLDIDKNSRYKSCSVNGVLYMTAGDQVMVKNLYSHTRIDLTSDATYFGGLLFAARTDT